MRHFMSDDGGKLGGIVHQRQEPARDIEISARKREGVHIRRIEDRHPVGLARIVGNRRQAANDLGHHPLELRV